MLGRVVSCCTRCCNWSRTTLGRWACWATWNGRQAGLHWPGSTSQQPSGQTLTMWPTCTPWPGWSCRKGTCRRLGSSLPRGSSWSPRMHTSCRLPLVPALVTPAFGPSLQHLPSVLHLSVVGFLPALMLACYVPACSLLCHLHLCLFPPLPDTRPLNPCFSFLFIVNVYTVLLDV